jgi:DNA-damage-inducible protein J
MPRKTRSQETVVLPSVSRRSKNAKTGTIRARVSPKLKAEAEGVFAQIGLTPSDAIGMFYSQVALRKGLPFEVRIPNATTRKALRDAEADRNMTNYASVDEMFEDLATDS